MEELINKAQNNDINAFEQLIAEHQATVYNIALKIMGNPDDAADAAQEALIKIFKNIKKFKGESKFSTWIYRIAHNVCIDEYRKRKNKSSYVTRSLDEQYEDGENPVLNVPDTSLTPEEQTLKNERIEMLNKAINSLSPISRTAILLRDVKSFSYEEIAKIQNCSLGTVKSRINRARLQLKEAIMKQNYWNKRHIQRGDEIG